MGSFSPATCASEKIPLGSQTPLFCLSAGNNVGLQIPLACVAVRNNGLPTYNTGIMLSERRRYHAQKSNAPLQGVRYACPLAVAEIAALLLAELPQDHRKRRPHVAGLVPAGSHAPRRALPNLHARQRPVRRGYTNRVNPCAKLCGKPRAGRPSAPGHVRDRRTSKKRYASLPDVQEQDKSRARPGMI